MSEPRTYMVQAPHMKGEDILGWQKEIKQQFKRMDIDCPIELDGDFGVASRSFTASLCHALGMIASEVMENGVTPALRIKIRNRRLTADEEKRYEDRVDYRRGLRARWERAAVRGVHRIVKTVISDSWGYHPGVHDGIDVVTERSAQIFAPVRCKVIDVRSGSWWGNNARPSSGFPVSAGDGIVQLEVLDSVGPFKKGYHIGFGHCENAVVRVGQVLDPGDRVARVGIANSSWHIHLMYNDGDTTRGVGDRDPRPMLDYAQKNG